MGDYGGFFTWQAAEPTPAYVFYNNYYIVGSSWSGYVEAQPEPPPKPPEPQVMEEWDDV